MNPEWEMILYVSVNNNEIKTWQTFETQDFYTYQGINYFDKLEELNIKIQKIELPSELLSIFSNLSPVHESDLFRYYELSKNGGFYCDMDILFFKPIDNFYNILINGNFDTVICQDTMLSIGLLASKQNNNFYNDIFNNGIRILNNQYESAGTNNIYNLFNNVNRIEVLNEAKRRYPFLNFYNIPSILVYYFRHYDIDRLIENSYDIKDFPSESIGYHWYGGHPSIQKYNNILNDKNYHEYDITFTKLAKNIL
jgi:hypothetical protein